MSFLHAFSLAPLSILVARPVRRVSFLGRRRMVAAVVALSASLAACGGLDESDVDDISPGDASGNAMSGRYTFETTVADVSCDEGWLIMSFVSVGGVVTQNDGKLTVQLDEEIMPSLSRFEGGLDDDGGFEVGGSNTHGYTEVGLITGTFDSAGCVADFEFRSFNGDDDPLDCTSFGTISCSRASE